MCCDNITDADSHMSNFYWQAKFHSIEKIWADWQTTAKWLVAQGRSVPSAHISLSHSHKHKFPVSTSYIPLSYIYIFTNTSTYIWENGREDTKGEIFLLGTSKLPSSSPPLHDPTVHHDLHGLKGRRMKNHETQIAFTFGSSNCIYPIIEKIVHFAIT